MNWWPAPCREGDLIRVKAGSVYHFGVFVSEDEVIQFGLPPTDLKAVVPGEVRVLATDIDAFSAGQIVEVAQLTPQERRSRLPAAETVRRARANLGEGGYDILHNNCEHFATACVFGRPASEQEESARKAVRLLFRRRERGDRA